MEKSNSRLLYLEEKMSPGLYHWRAEKMSAGLNQWREEMLSLSDISMRKGGIASHMLPSSYVAGRQNGGLLDESNKAKDGDTVKTGDKAYESKKNDVGKGIRSFKFALADFVIDLLKPKWKEGHLSKNVHKTIARKVVNKVIGSIEATRVPQTKANIDSYLSLARPKILKLVQEKQKREIE